MNSTTVKLPIIIASLIVLSACGNKKEEASKIPLAETIPVKIMPLEQVNEGKAISASGQFSTDDEVILSFKKDGIVSQVLVKEGDYVKTGQTLARMDLTEINTNVAQSQLAVAKAQRDYQRVSNLYKDSTATLEQLQNVQTGLDIAKQQYDAALFNLNHSEIRAVENGYVLKKFVNTGQLVTTGQAILQTNGAGKGHWILKAGMSDIDWSAVSIGDRASIKIDALENEEIIAKVIRKSQGIDAGNGTLSVDLDIDSRYTKYLASGMFGSAKINAHKTTTTWKVPYGAILDGNGGKGFVFVTNDNKIAIKVPVKIASIEKNTAGITEGLEGYKALIISGSAYLTDKSNIKIIN